MDIALATLNESIEPTEAGAEIGIFLKDVNIPKRQNDAVSGTAERSREVVMLREDQFSPVPKVCEMPEGAALQAGRYAGGPHSLPNDPSHSAPAAACS